MVYSEGTVRFLLISAIWVFAVSGVLYILYRIIRKGLAAAEENRRERAAAPNALQIQAQTQAQVHLTTTTEVTVNGRRVEDPSELDLVAQRMGEAMQRTGEAMQRMDEVMQRIGVQPRDDAWLRREDARLRVGPSLRSFEYAARITPPTTTRKSRDQTLPKKEKAEPSAQEPPNLWDHLMED